MEISSHNKVKNTTHCLEKNLFRLYWDDDVVCSEHHTKHMKAFYGKVRVIPYVKRCSKLHKLTAKF